jgi:hypothetical protein
MVESILDGRHGHDVTLAGGLEPFSVEWEAQREALAHTM